MRFLLDTHVFLWCVNGDRRLSKSVRARILDADAVYVSSASIWEAVIKKQLKKLEVDLEELVQAITLSGFTELPVTARHAIAVGNLPDVHRDPFDRLLIAQAMSEPLIFLTADELLCGYSELVQLLT